MVLTSSAIKSIAIIMAVGAAIFGYNACRLLFHVSPLEALFNILALLFGGEGAAAKAMANLNASMKSQTMRMSKDERKKSWKYKYQVLINDILLDMGWKQMGVTINGVSMIALIASLLVSAFGYMAVNNLFATLVLFIFMFVMTIVVLFSVSRGRHRERKALLIQAEDALCSSMQNGVVEAVRLNLSNFDPEIRGDFQSFLDDIDMNIPTIEAIDRLNDRLGSKFDNFCEKAKDITENYQPGSEDNFQFNITSNAIESELDNEIFEYAEAANLDYFCTLGLMVIFFFITNSMYAGMTEFYFEGPGRFLLVFYITIAALVYIFTQWETSRRT